MTTKSGSWEQVSETLERLGKHVRGPIDDARADAAADREVLEEAVRSLINAIEGVVNAAGTVARDPAVRKDLVTLATSLRRTLLAEFERVVRHMPARETHRPSRTTSPRTSSPRTSRTTATRPAARAASTRRAAAH